MAKLKTENIFSFSEIFSEHQNSVFSICFRFTGDKQEAEDLCQDIFLQIYKSLPDFKSQSKLSTWIYRIAVNHSLNHVRNRKKHNSDLRITSENQETIVADPHRNHTENRPDKILEEKERGIIVSKAIESLPENQRLVLILQKYEGFSCKEIADIQECTLLSVQSRLHRAKKNLGKLLLKFINEI